MIQLTGITRCRDYSVATFSGEPDLFPDDMRSIEIAVQTSGRDLMEQEAWQKLMRHFEERSQDALARAQLYKLRAQFALDMSWQAACRMRATPSDAP